MSTIQERMQSGKNPGKSIKATPAKAQPKKATQKPKIKKKGE